MRSYPTLAWNMCLVQLFQQICGTLHLGKTEDAVAVVRHTSANCCYEEFSGICSGYYCDLQSRAHRHEATFRMLESKENGQRDFSIVPHLEASTMKNPVATAPGSDSPM